MTVQWLRGYWFIASSLLALFLVAFIVVEALHLPLLSDPAPWLTKAGYAAAAVGVGLLVADVLLPVPASIVMIAQGALFGIAGGTALSLVGGLGATLVGFLIGRRGRGLVNRIVSPQQQARAEDLLQRYGIVAIIATRPVPMLAETTAIIAGTSTMGWRSAAVGGIAGNFIPALLYAITGALAISLGNEILVFTVVIGVAALFWLLARPTAVNRVDDPPQETQDSPSAEGNLS